MAVAELKTRRIHYKGNHRKVKKKHRDILVQGTKSSRKLEGLERIVGQDVALRRTLQVMDWESPNANLHYIGGPGVGKTYTAATAICEEAEHVEKHGFDPDSVRHPDPKIRRAFAKIIKKKAANKPPEQLGLYNHDIPEHPITVALPEPGLVDRFARDMRTFVEAYAERMLDDVLDLGEGFERWKGNQEAEFRKKIERQYSVGDGLYIKYRLRHSTDRPGLFFPRLNVTKTSPTIKTKRKIGKEEWDKKKKVWSGEFHQRVFEPAYSEYRRRTDTISAYIKYLQKTVDPEQRVYADIVESFLEEVNDLRQRYGRVPYTMEELAEKTDNFVLFPNSAENITRLHTSVLREGWVEHPEIVQNIDRILKELLLPRIYRDFEDDEIDPVNGIFCDSLRPRRGVERRMNNGSDYAAVSHSAIRDRAFMVEEVNSLNKENFFGQIEFDSTNDKPNHHLVTYGYAAQCHYVLVDEGKGLTDDPDFLNEVLTYLQKGKYQIQGGEGGRNVGRGNIVTRVEGTARLWICSNDEIFEGSEAAKQRFQGIPFQNYADFTPEVIQRVVDMFHTSMEEYRGRENGDEVSLPRLSKTGMQKIGQLLAAVKYRRGRISVSFRDPLNFGFLTAIGERLYDDDSKTEITGDDIVAAVRQSMEDTEVFRMTDDFFANDQYPRDDYQVGRIYGVGVGETNMPWPSFGSGRIGGIEARVRIGNEVSGKIFSSYSAAGKAGPQTELAEFVSFQGLGKYSNHLGFNVDMHHEWEYEYFDGPSSGIAQQVAMMSAITGVRLSQNVVITGCVKDITEGFASTIGGVAFKTYSAYSNLKQFCERHDLDFAAQGYKFIMPEMNHDEYALWEEFLPEDFVQAVADSDLDLYTVDNITQAFMISAHQDDLTEAVGTRGKITEKSIDALMETRISEWNERHMELRRQHYHVA